VSGQLQGQLDLTVMVTLVPAHVLEQSMVGRIPASLAKSVTGPKISLKKYLNRAETKSRSSALNIRSNTTQGTPSLRQRQYFGSYGYVRQHGYKSVLSVVKLFSFSHKECLAPDLTELMPC
jgi:hypothetical protein